MRAALLLVALALALAGCGTGEGAAPGSSDGATATRADEPAGLLRALRAGGFVIFFRHAATVPGGDTDLQDLHNCALQRNLSAEGRAQAREIGRAFRQLAIPVGTVRSSALCRTRDTASLAFGEFQESLELTALPHAETESEEERRVEVLRRMLATPPPAGRNTVLVSHLFHIQRAADLSLEEGEAVVVRPHEGGFTVVEKLSPADWAALGR